MAREWFKTDRVGDRFNRLLVISRAETTTSPSGHRRAMWLCRCDCGVEKVVASRLLLAGKAKSCGCLLLEMNTKLREQRLKRIASRPPSPPRKRVPPPPRVIHGMARTRTYRIWRKMIERCTNQKHESYVKYGARGISICTEWKTSFQAFYDDMGAAPESMSIDRINTLGNYEPGNCRWATSKEQSRNARHNVWVELAGKRMILTDAAAALGVSVSTAKKRLLAPK